jgi:hypothetical protein
MPGDVGLGGGGSVARREEEEEEAEGVTSVGGEVYGVVVGSLGPAA